MSKEAEARSPLTKPATRNLAVDLTEDEQRKLGLELAELEGELSHVKANAKDAADSFKEEAGGIQSKIRSVSRTLRDGYEVRPVECEWAYHWPEGKATLVRLDTGDEIEERAITAAERQMELDQ